MKFTGLHFHMVLVLAVIGVIIYIFYVSKDIVTLDAEVRNMRTQLDIIKRHLTPTQIAPPQAVAKFDAATMMDTSVAAKPQPATPAPTPITEEEEQPEEEEGASMSAPVADADADADAVDAAAVPAPEESEMLARMVAAADEDTDDAEDNKPTDISTWTIMELRTYCKSNGISAKGSKKDIIEAILAAQ